MHCVTPVGREINYTLVLDAVQTVGEANFDGRWCRWTFLEDGLCTEEQGDMRYRSGRLGSRRTPRGPMTPGNDADTISLPGPQWC